MKIIVLQGAPASGKSTRAMELLKENPSAVIVSRNAIRHGTGTYWAPKREDYITDIEEYSVKRALGKMYDVIIDATNLDPVSLTRWKSIAVRYNAELIMEPVYASMETCIKRDANPNRSHHVGEKVIRAFFTKYKDQLTPPVKEEDKEEEIIELL